MNWGVLGEFNIYSTMFRLVLSMILSGILGIERGQKRRPAGFRTYMVVCIGSTLAMLTNQYVFINIGASDPTRIAAQVISGIGFLGAGTIIVTGRNQVKGLTTAAGLWAAAALGLAIGVGYYDGAIFGCLLLFVTMNMLHYVERYFTSKAKTMLVYVEFSDIEAVSAFLSYARKNGLNTTDIEMNKRAISGESIISAMVTINMAKRIKHAAVIELLSKAESVSYIEEL